MKLQEFLDEYGGAPYDIQELAHIAVRVENDKVLRDRAQAFLRALEDFDTILNDVGYERG